MNKLVVLGMGTIGVGGASIGGYFAFRPEKETFKSKYKHSLLSKEGDTAIWDARHASLNGKSPKYQKLKDAVTNYSSTENSKKLHKEACLEIYDLPAENNEYLEDFELYCTKNIGDVIAPKTFIEDAKETTTEWDKKLNNLKALTAEKLGTLDLTLKNLKNTIGGSSLEVNHRETLKNWCDGMKSKMFIGNEDSKFQDFVSYCTK